MRGRIPKEENPQTKMRHMVRISSLILRYNRLDIVYVSWVKVGRNQPTIPKKLNSMYVWKLK
uniref:Uncharacterized protein n=1 Tax=Moorena producens (strain JHB) TaxID=1454205 RepID=A0A1D9G457_MOOP1